MSRLAILAGSGQLPVSIDKVFPDALKIAFDGMPTDIEPDHVFKFEHLGTVFETLHANGVERVVMAGAMSRPSLDPSLFDTGMALIAPRLLASMAGGDDGLLREIIQIFEEQGFKVVGAHSLLPELTADEGQLSTGELTDTVQADIKRADAILGSMSPVDVGQAVVVEGGVCLGIETIQGTDALLGFVASTAKHLRRGSGVLVKRPKVGQDLRVDMPTIGPATIKNAKQAGLSAIVISPGSVLLLDRESLITTANEAGILLLARRHS